MFFGAFLGPILAVLLFNVVIFVITVTVLVRHTRNTMGRMKEQMNHKTAVRLLISITGIIFLFGLTWVFGALTISDASLPFQILFVIFNGFQGFFIFLFFCVFSKDARELWIELLSCGRYKFSTSHPSSRGANKYSTGGTRKPKSTGTGSYALTALSNQKSDPPTLSLVSDNEVSEAPYISEPMPIFGEGTSTFGRSNKVKGRDVICIENSGATVSPEIQSEEAQNLKEIWLVYEHGEVKPGKAQSPILGSGGAENGSEKIVGAYAERSDNPTETREHELEVSQMEFDIEFNDEGGIQV